MLIPKPIFEVARCAATDPARFQLLGVNFSRDENGFPIADATDGVVLARARWTEEPGDEYPVVDGISPAHKPGFSAILPTDACRDAAKLAPKKPPVAILTNVLLDEPSANGTATVFATDLSSPKRATFHAIDGHFPDFSGVIPEPLSEDSKSRVMVNPRRLLQALETLLKTMDYSKGDGDPRCVLELHGDKPVVLRAANAGKSIVAMCMPCIK